ncbi:MAG: glycosyltransferase [Chloracidobacterium sp.]|nr:glycosyltransferase [Chloracidobacterium sp.]
MANELSIIIVNWNGAAFLPACLESIVENPPSCSFEIVVVDNASTDTSVEWMKSENAKNLLGDTNFRLIESDENLGFGRGNNLAITETDSETVFLLNPDTLIKAKSVDILLKTLVGEEGVGAVGPKLRNMDGSLQPSVWSFPPTPLKYLFEGLKLQILLPKKFRGKWLRSSHWAHDERIAVNVLSGAAILAKKR